MTKQVNDKQLEKLAGGVDGSDFLIWQSQNGPGPGNIGGQSGSEDQGTTDYCYDALDR